MRKKYGKRHDGVYASIDGQSVYLFVTQQDDWPAGEAKYGDRVLSSDEARELANALIEMADELDGIEPKPKSFNDQTAHLPVGTVLAFDGDKDDLWIKTVSGWRGIGQDGNTWEPFGIDDSDGSWNLNEFDIVNGGE